MSIDATRLGLSRVAESGDRGERLIGSGLKGGRRQIVVAGAILDVASRPRLGFDRAAAKRLINAHDL